MRTRELVSEAWRNLGLRQIIVALALLAAVTAATAMVGWSGRSALEQEAERRAAGSLVWQIRPADGVTIQASDCVRLGGVDGVVSAGVLAARPVVTAFAGGPPLPVIRVTPQFAEVWFAGGQGDSVLVGRTLARSNLIAPGAALFQDGQPIGNVGRQLTRLIPDAEAETSVLMVTSAQGALSRCVVRLPTGSTDMGPALAAWAFGRSAVSVQRVAPPLVGVASPAQQWRGVVGLQPWLIGAVLPLLVATLASLTRRSELAVYRTFGASVPLAVALQQVEFLLVAVPAMVVGTCAGLLLVGAPTPPVVMWQAASQGFACAAVTFALAPLAWLAGSAGRVFGALKDR